MPLFESASPQPLPSELRWHYVKIKPGEAVYGYVAGKMVGVWVHWLGGSKPCRSKMTNKTLPCPHCVDDGPRLRWLGYLPLWDRSGRRVVVVVSNQVGPAVELLVYAQPVRLARTSGARDPLRVETPEPHMDMRLAERLFRDGPHDLTPWLIHLWQDRELASWLKARSGATGTGEHNAGSPTPGVTLEMQKRLPLADVLAHSDRPGSSILAAAAAPLTHLVSGHTPNGKPTLLAGDVPGIRAAVAAADRKSVV